MPEYLQVRSNGQITLPASTRRKAKITEGDLLEAIVDADGTIHLVPKRCSVFNTTSPSAGRMYL